MSEGDEAVALTTEEIDARLAGIDLPEGEPQYKFFKPTADAVDRWVEYAKGSHDCFHLGLQDIDSRTAVNLQCCFPQWHATYLKTQTSME